MSIGLDVAERPAEAGYLAAQSVRARPRLVTREIGDADLVAVAALLHEGFPEKPLSWCRATLASLARLPHIAGMPQYGYMLAEDGEPIGVVLTLVSNIQHQGKSVTRLNVACWYVRPRYRAFGTVLYQRILALPGVTFLNVTPAAHTWPVIEAQGFRRFTGGTFAGLPLLGRPALGMRVRPWGDPADQGLSVRERDLLAFHAAAGCITLTCSTRTRTLPFVFRRRAFRNLPPAAHLIYCRDIDDLGDCAGAIGRHLARHSLAWVVAGTNAALSGMPGRYFPDKSPMYFRGPSQPRLGDLAFTEIALLSQ